MALHSALAQKGSSPEGLDPFHTSLREEYFSRRTCHWEK